MIYLDHNATAPIDPRVVDAMTDCDRQQYVNPASSHRAGRKARRVLEALREQTARRLGAETSGMAPDRLIYTSGGAEANNLALRGLVGAPPVRIVVSAIEHPTVAGAADFLKQQGCQVERLQVTSEGIVDLEHLTQLLTTPSARPVRLVSVMLGNNETGVLQPIREIVSRCRSLGGEGVLVHTDAVQAVGKIVVDFRELGVDAMSFTAHKFQGPRGVGGLLVGPHTPLTPILHGGFQQGGLRPGTESVTLAVGMHEALAVWERDARQRTRRMSALRDQFETSILGACPQAVVNGRFAPRLPHTSNMSFVGLDRQALFMALDMAGVACSTGSACASGSNEPSPVLLAMGCPRDVVQGALRFSLGAGTTADEIEEAVEKIVKIVRGRPKVED